MKSNMKLSFFDRNIEYFLRCANAPSLNHAASEIGISQSALSIAIQNLEEELGVILFERSRRGSELTAKGKAIHAKLNNYRQLIWRDLISELRSSADIPLKIGSVEHFAAKHLFPLIKKEWRKAKIQLFMMRSLVVHEAVEAGKIDFGFITWSKLPKTLKYILIAPESLAIVGLRSKFGHIEKARSLDDLKSEPWIYTPKPQRDWTKFLEFDRVGYVAGGFFSHHQAIMAGLGIAEAQLDAFSEKDLSLLARAPVPTPRRANNYLVYRNGTPPALVDIAEAMAKEIKSQFH